MHQQVKDFCKRSFELLFDSINKLNDFFNPKSDEEAIDEWLSDRRDRFKFEKELHKAIVSGKPVKTIINGKNVTIHP
jgi:hypothetical protein